MARSNGRHRISRRTKIATAGVALAMAGGALVLFNTAGDPASARADAADPSFFVDITKVRPNVQKPREQRNASTGTFTVDCGENQNGHFNPDNFIAQPGVKNGAQHLHDYVGNLTTNADSNNKSLLRGGTTCKNGDQSAYFWPVIRIDREDNNGQSQQDKAKQEAAQQKNQGNNKNNGNQNNNRRNNQGQNNQQNNNNQQQNNNASQDQNQNDKASQDNNNDSAQNQDGTNDQAGQNNGQNDNANQSDQGASQQKSQNGGKFQRLRDLIDKFKQARQNKNNNNQQNDQNNNNDNNADQNNNNQDLPGVDDKNQVAGNDGQIIEPRDAKITFVGSPVGPVEAMPKFLRILYGDAKVNINGPKNARDSWTCAGFENKVLMNKYPICPNGAAVKRIHAFPSCWDGQNTDSANHRDHIVFPDNNGRCRNGFTAVPQLTITLTYDIPQDVQEKGQYKVDSFPEEEHDPFSDHDDFANVMSNAIMNRVVDCINNGKTCNE